MSQGQEKAIARVLTAIDRIKAGKMVIMVDDEDRENEGDLVFVAQYVDPEKVNFMAREARGLICLTLAPAMVTRLRLPLMGPTSPSQTEDNRATAFTVSIEARHGVTTGISAKDRAETIRVAIAETSGPEDIVVPGHVFPLRSRPGGVLERSGHTEGSVDLARLAGLKPAGVICEIMKDDGTMARLPDLEAFSQEHAIPIVSIADLITFRLLKESLVEVVEQGKVSTSHGSFDGYLFKSLVDQSYHFALSKGEAFDKGITDVRVHRQRILVDVFQRGQKEDAIDYGLKLLRDCERGIMVYLSPMNNNQVMAGQFKLITQGNISDDEHLQPSGTAMAEPPEVRLFGTGAQILRHLGVKKMRVHSTAPRPLKALAGFGLEIVEQVKISCI